LESLGNLFPWLNFLHRSARTKSAFFFAAHPLIWRRLLLASDTSIAQLHRILQIAFAWGGEHLHRFRIHGKDYGIAYLGGISFKDDLKKVRLFKFRLHCRECFRYDYDFIANWNLEIRLEKDLPSRSPTHPTHL